MKNSYEKLSIGERIELLAKHMSGNVNKFATHVLNHPNNSRIKGSISSGNPKYETLIEILEKTKVSAAWLMQGKGGMFDSHAASTEATLTQKEVYELIDRTIKRLTDSHNEDMGRMDRILKTYEGIMRRNDLLSN